jgi:hypothetical protein
MFQTGSLFNLLFNKKVSTKHIRFSTQELYFLYLIFKRNGLKLNFFQFFNFFFLIKYNNISLDKLYTLLFLFFHLKTNSVHVVHLVKSLESNPINISNTYVHNHPVVAQKLTVFWKKFKKLKRPTTDSNFNEFFLKSWEKKINTYTTLGFFKTIDVFYLVGLGLNNFKQTTVTINKPLITSPKFSSTSIVKYLNVDYSNTFEFQYLRKNKVYNKGRYSRCRQNYRTGVYMCMYLSVCSIFGLYYWFYKFTFNFSYLWWFFIFFAGSFFFPKIVKYRLYEPTVLFSKFFDFFKWLGSLVRSIFF